MRSLVPGGDFRSSLNSGSHKKSFAVVFVTASDAMDFCFVFCLSIVSCSWDKILHSKFRNCFWKEEICFSGGLFLEAMYQSSEVVFAPFFNFFYKDYRGKLTTHSEPLHRWCDLAGFFVCLCVCIVVLQNLTLGVFSVTVQLGNGQ